MCVGIRLLLYTSHNSRLHSSRFSFISLFSLFHPPPLSLLCAHIQKRRRKKGLSSPRSPRSPKTPRARPPSSRGGSPSRAPTLALPDKNATLADRIAWARQVRACMRKSCVHGRETDARETERDGERRMGERRRETDGRETERDAERLRETQRDGERLRETQRTERDGCQDWFLAPVIISYTWGAGPSEHRWLSRAQAPAGVLHARAGGTVCLEQPERARTDRKQPPCLFGSHMPFRRPPLHSRIVVWLLWLLFELFSVLFPLSPSLSSCVSRLLSSPLICPSPAGVQAHPAPGLRHRAPVPARQGAGAIRQPHSTRRAGECERRGRGRVA